MVDCTHANLHLIDVSFMKSNQLAAGYNTGNPDVRWTPNDWQYVIDLGLKTVTIDQGFTGSPIPTANVRDVEAGAWPTDLVTDETNWTTPRPTIYADRTNALILINQGWRKALWIAWPNNHIPTKAELINDMPELALVDLIGAQIGTTNTFDHSVIFDPYWPAPIPKGESVNFVTLPNIPGNWTIPPTFFPPDENGNIFGFGYGTTNKVYQLKLAKGATAWTLTQVN
jgi:hypothetical protein